MTFLRIFSIVLEWFVGISAIAGGFYLIPEITLAVVIGGTQIIAALAKMMKSALWVDSSYSVRQLRKSPA